jgi:hypothetical protein
MAMTPIFGEFFDAPNREEIPDREKNERALLDRVRSEKQIWLWILEITSGQHTL